MTGSFERTGEEVDEQGHRLPWVLRLAERPHEARTLVVLHGRGANRQPARFAVPDRESPPTRAAHHAHRGAGRPAGPMTTPTAAPSGRGSVASPLKLANPQAPSPTVVFGLSARSHLYHMDLQFELTFEATQ